MKVNCPTCKTQIEWSEAYEFRPFCCKRCQLIDLGQWADEAHAIPSDKHQHDLLPDNIDVEEVEAMLAKAAKNADDFFQS
ncbi:DNA gyrase inhibitor YacG [Glaciecola sp. 2405UD65-10]|uniref:DNA gyrase inhibitor YacG n=1 Tax=Glaciecola sp. 2405UD65-10 TaxID=3397244 RepID=UPI003B595B7C